MEFRCKTFSLNHSHSTMKVGTDAVLLASIVTEFFANLNTENPIISIQNSNLDVRNSEITEIHGDGVGENAVYTNGSIRKILDIGTGCGILSLCMAQIFDNAKITAIDIDEKSVNESTDNFYNSPFAQRMSANTISVQDFAYNTEEKFDLIISNPPFFTSSLQSPDLRRNNARHNAVLSTEDFVLSCTKLLSVNGFVAVVLPEKEMVAMITLFNSKDINPVLITNVFAKPGSPLKRKICIFSVSNKENIVPITKTLYIRTANNEYSKHYRQLTSHFLL